jgi:hypothetical protein
MSGITQRNLQDCCNGLKKYTPASIENRGGLSAVVYRTGTQATFKATMLAALSSAALPELSELTTRDDDDFSIALIDAWASVLDVLTFYSERDANEHYLLTATERRSLKWMAELIGYRPRPGLAAEAWLAFTVEEAEGAPQVTTVNVGTQVQSIPKPDELPQVFEIMADQEVRARWNAMTPRRFYPQVVDTDMSQVLLEGNFASLRPGSHMLVVDDDDNRAFKTVARVRFEGAKNQTLVEFSGAGSGLTPSVTAVSSTTLDYSATAPVYDVGQVFGGNEVSWGASHAYYTYNAFPITQVVSIFQGEIIAQEEPPDTEIAPDKGLFVLKGRAAVFGHNAPDYAMLPIPDGVNGDKIAAYGKDWTDRTLFCDTFIDGDFNDCCDSGRDQTNQIFLDQIYSDVLPGSWIVVVGAGGEPKALRVASTSEISRAQFTINSKVTKVNLSDMLGSVTDIAVRDATVHCASEPVPLALVEDTSLIKDNEIILSDYYPELTPGMQVIVSGEVPALGNLLVHERVEVAEALTVDLRTKLVFKQALQNDYTRSTVAVNANVVRATHGETHSVVLGNGQSDQAFQTVPTLHKPLTYLADPSSDDGAASTLEVRVDQVRWAEEPSFFEQAADARVYVTRRNEEDLAHVIFGDGEHGRRPATGQENISAVYRSGLGLAGNLDEDQLALLLQKPHGVRSVTNPLPAQGGADPDGAEEIRRNATLGMRTLGRIVSLQDYQDYARSYNGIGKAHAAWAWAGESQGIFVTVGGQTEEPLSDETLKNLLQSLRRFGDPLLPLTVRNYAPRHFQIAAKVFYHADYLAEVVESAVRETLHRAYSYDQRDFGRNVTIDEVVALIQAVTGVVAVDLDALHLINESAEPNPVLKAELPRRGDSFADITPATLLLLTPEPATLTLTSV